MQLQFRGKSFTYPSTPDELTIGRWIGYVQEYGDELELWRSRIDEVEDEAEKSIEESLFFVEQAYCLFAFFADADVDKVKKEVPVQQVTEAYAKHFSGLFVKAESLPENGFILPPPVLSPSSEMTFGEFIDSKIVCEAYKEKKRLKWEALPELAAIFYRKKGEAYDASFLFDDSARLKEMNQLPISVALYIGDWFEQFNTFLKDSFPLFKKSRGVKSGKYMAQHFEQWGWINFQKSIAKEKVFDIPGSGLNSIECARKEKAYEVLVWASEEKAQSEAMSLDMEAATKK